MCSLTAFFIASTAISAVSSVAQGFQARNDRKRTERANEAARVRQAEDLRRAEEATTKTTGSGEDPARTLADAIKNSRASDDLAKAVGFNASGTPTERIFEQTGLSI